jgi:WhiB family redox-sensing transcriptional regulator
VSIVYDAFATHDGGTSFAELLNRPPWQSDALCKEYPAAWWFPTQGQDTTRAQAVCAICLVRDECAAYALDDKHIQGIWGGLTGQGRRRLRATAA